MEFFHVLNRGLDKQDVFVDDGDRQRFVQGMYVFNDVNPAPNGITQNKLWSDLGRERSCLVKIHAWCLMRNHYHILLSPVDDDITNISKFMKKLNMGYAKFFNEKYERSGYLWQGKYKKIHIERDSHFIYIPYYIHLNPLDVKFKSWREGGLKNNEEALKYLGEYRWSSWFDYTGKKNFPSVIDQRVLTSVLGTKKSQLDEIKKIVCSEDLSQRSMLIET